MIAYGLQQQILLYIGGLLKDAILKKPYKEVVRFWLATCLSQEQGFLLKDLTLYVMLLIFSLQLVLR